MTVRILDPDFGLFRDISKDISLKISSQISTKLGMLVTAVRWTCLARLSGAPHCLSGCVGECSSLAEVCTLWAHS